MPQKHTVANEQVTTLQQQRLFLLKSCEKKKFKSEKGKERVGWFCGGGGGGDPRMRRKRIVESIVSRRKVLSRAAALRKKKKERVLNSGPLPRTEENQGSFLRYRRRHAHTKHMQHTRTHRHAVGKSRAFQNK